MTSMDLSIVISCSRPDKLLICLSGFKNQNTDFDFEVIAVGDVPDAALGCPFPCVLLPLANPHANARRNRGIAQAQATRIALMDDDCVPEPDWVNEAVQSSAAYGVIITGRELAYAENRFSQITHAALSCSFIEINSGHLNRKAQQVKWYEVVFCNCIIPRDLLVKNPLRETIPWDMDDFHFCHSVRKEYVFYNNPGLVVKHDRYPGSFRNFVRYKWHLRVRTGEKIITHPRIYLRIPGVVLSALVLPLSLIAALLTALAPFVMAVVLLLYVMLAFVCSFYQCRRFGISGVGQGILIFLTVHLLTASAVQFGMLMALKNKFKPGMRA